MSGRPSLRLTNTGGAGRGIRCAGIIGLLALLCSAAIAQTNQNSFVDPTFDPGSGADGGFVEAVVVQPDGKVLVCGSFTTFNGQTHHNIARLNPDGSLDSSFQADVGYWVRNMALQNDGKVVIGGFFTDVGGVPRNRVARLNADGSLDTSFDPGTGCQGRIVPVDPTDPFIFAIGLRSDGKIVIGGNFTTYNGTPRSGLARLNPDGSLDTSFDVGSGVNSWVRSLRVQSDGHVLVSGWFTTYNDQGHNRMVILNDDGSAVITFAPNFGDSTAVYSMAPLPNGQFVVGGHSVNTNAPFTTEVVRLNPDGSFDPTFNPGGSGANDKVEFIVLLSDGKFFIAGYFNQYNGQPAAGVARLNSDGTQDSSFTAAVNNWVFSGALQENGTILICGGFTLVDTFARGGVARLLPGLYVPPPPVVTPTPVTTIPGIYNGIFFDTNQPQQNSSGFMTLKLSANGTFSGKMAVGGGSSAFTGRFSTNGTASVQVARRGNTTVTISLTFNPDDQRVEGSVSDGNWTAALAADRNVWGAANKATAYVGRYTLAIPGSSDPTTAPGGDGYGAFTVDQLGTIRYAGTMADGTSFSQQTTLSKDGLWPFFGSLYSSKGVVIGWIAFTNSNGTLGGNLTWIRPAARSAYYPAGFNVQSAAIGSFYTPPAPHGAVLDLNAATVTLTGGNLTDPLSIPVNVAPTTVVSDGSTTNKLRLVMDPRTGLMQGSFVIPPRTTRTVRGVVLQNQSQARGFFLGPSQSGEMLLQ